MAPVKASQKYHWCKYDKATNTVELYLDHYMLSGLRTCEAKFYLEHLLWIKPRQVNKPWFLDFGEYIHWCLEQFYNHFKLHKTSPKVDVWMALCTEKWKLMKMDEYKESPIEADSKKYKDVQGWEGVAGLLIQYYAYYMDQRMRVIDTEITFGHNKEVLIGSFAASYIHQFGLMQKVDCYLTGRIDLLVDNGYKIGPIDHKTTHKFDGFEHQDFNPHDAMTGYIFACHEILKNYDLSDRKIQCMGGWIQHISSCTPSTPRDKTKKPGPRFKTTPVDKTLSQFDDFKQRQLSTFKRVADLLFNDKTPEWQTGACHNMFFRNCEYVPIHEQPSEQWPDIINRFYQISNPWDTRDYSSKDKLDVTKESTNK